MTFTEELLLIAEERANAEGLQSKTLTRQKAAINAFSDVLSGHPTRMIRPGRWIGLYSAEEATSTVISNMKFVAAILEWEGVKNHPNTALCVRVARAIRQALAVRVA